MSSSIPITGVSVTLTGTDNVELETLLGSAYIGQQGADLYMCNPSSNSGVLEVHKQGQTIGTEIPVGSTVVFPGARVADGLWAVTGTSGDELRVLLYGPESLDF